MEDKLKEVYKRLIKKERLICIIIYCPPKVGSTTLVSSLRLSLGDLANVIHIHDEVMLGVLTEIKDITVNEIICYLSTVINKVYVIDVYRTPIERKMSEYFDKLSFHFNNEETNIMNYKIELLIERFNKLFPYLGVGEHYLDKYNIAEPIGFNFAEKYTVQKIKNVDYVKLRICDVSDWSDILSKILNKRIVIVNDYLTEDKLLGEKYNEFKSNYRLPINFYELVRKDSNLCYYLNEKERKNYLEKWYKKLQSDVFLSFTQMEYNFYLEITKKNQFYDSIERNHYIDNGCFCKACSKKREELYLNAVKGETIKDKIIHSECILQMKKQLINRAKETISKSIAKRKKMHNTNNIAKINTNLF